MQKSMMLILCFAFVCNAEVVVNKVVIPAAGFGTRFLPVTKAIPKEMIPLAGKPAIQVVVEEAMASGINHIIPIISKHKSAIVNHFDPAASQPLRELGKYHMIEQNDKKFSNVNFSFVNQEVQLGLGHAVLMAKEVIGQEYFGVILPDEIVFNDEEPAMGQLIEIAKRENASVIAVLEVPHEKVSSYGIVSLKDKVAEGLFEIDQMVEKPAIDKAPSNLAIIGRYVLSPKVFDSLEKLLAKHTTGELQLTDAILHMMKESGERVLAYKVRGDRHDIGVPGGWLRAVVTDALKNSEYKNIILSCVAQG